MTPPIVDMRAVQRVLIIKMSALGDIIHALPVSAALGEAFPHLNISWYVEEPFAPLLTGNPYLSEIITLPKFKSRDLRSPRCLREIARSMRYVRSQRFDMTLDLQGLTKSAIVTISAGARTRLGYHWLREASTLVERPVPRRPESVHIVDQYLDVARHVGAHPTCVRFPFHIPEEDEAAVTSMLCAEGLEPDAAFVAINPASAQAIKQWGAGRYAALMDTLHDRLDIPSVLVTADAEVAAQVAAQTRRPFVNLARRTSLKQLAAVLRRSAVHICGDTGSGHLAAALERPVVSLIGPTDPDRACPYGQRENTLNHREACGTGCTAHRCQFERPRCLEAIEVNEVAAKVETLLRKGGNACAR
ncbi:MAG TPA: glycosyltransferase family 9 protein [Chthonomonadaceae bacterium]|nr:glycosyltransferase family 9 protein [Chthonomonadaceae bacterium]